MEEHQEANVDKIIALVDVVVTNVELENVVVQLVTMEEHHDIVDVYYVGYGGIQC
jgi:hypothetical protein